MTARTPWDIREDRAVAFLSRHIDRRMPNMRLVREVDCVSAPTKTWSFMTPVWPRIEKRIAALGEERGQRLYLNRPTARLRHQVSLTTFPMGLMLAVYEREKNIRTRLKRDIEDGAMWHLMTTDPDRAISSPAKRRILRGTAWMASFDVDLDDLLDQVNVLVQQYNELPLLVG